MQGTVEWVSVKPKTAGKRGLPKSPVASAVVTRGGVVGDFNVYRHEEEQDDLDSALLVLPLETIRDLNSEGWPVSPGDLGENLTTSGLPYSSFSVGNTYTAGGVRFQISRACDPCDNLFLLPYVGESKGPAFLKAMLGRRGWYARVIREGIVRQGDRIVVDSRAQTAAEQQR